jgi:hypothetical protein
MYVARPTSSPTLCSSGLLVNGPRFWGKRIENWEEHVLHGCIKKSGKICEEVIASCCLNGGGEICFLSV